MIKVNYAVANILANHPIAPAVYDMTVAVDGGADAAQAGQFAQIFVPRGEHILPRPISICDINREKGRLRFVYQVVGQGTRCFSELPPGTALKLLVPAGNSFPVLPDKKEIAVVGGGVGVPPMLALVKKVKAALPDARVTVFLGFRTTPFLINDFAALGVSLHIATEDGSVGFQGNVTQLMTHLNYDCELVYACGPKPMLKALSQWASAHHAQCFVSMEERMACGVGACVGCAIPIKTGEGSAFIYKKVCKDGPVFDSAEVAWDEL